MDKTNDAVRQQSPANIFTNDNFVGSLGAGGGDNLARIQLILPVFWITLSIPKYGKRPSE